MNRTHIKIIVVFLFLSCLSIALYLRRPKDTTGPKWDEGFLSIAECCYYNSSIISIIKEWNELEKRNQSQPDSSNQVFLVVDMDKKALWVEENGIIRSNRYIDLAPGVDWTFYYYSTKSTSLKNGKIILRNINDKTVLKNPEQFILIGSGKKRNVLLTIIDTVGQLRPGIVNFNPGTFVNSINFDELESPFIVTKDEYEEYNDFLANSSASITEEEKQRQRNIRLSDGFIASWKRMEKMLYMEIEKRVHKAGYQLIDISVSMAYFRGMRYADFQAARASVIARHSSLIKRLINKSPSLSESYIAFRLSDPGVWYVANDPYLQKTPINQKFIFDFIIFSSDLGQSLRKNNYIGEGRKIIKTLPDPNTPYIDW